MADDEDKLKFTADLSDVRREIDRIAEQPVNVRIQPRDERGRFRSADYGVTPSGGEIHPGAGREDARVQARIDSLGEGGGRVDRVQARNALGQFQSTTYQLAPTSAIPPAFSPPTVSMGDSGEGGMGGGGGGGRGWNGNPPGVDPMFGRGGIWNKGMGRFFGIGLAAREVLHAAREAQEYGTEMYVAGSDQEMQLDATLKYRKRLLDLPIVGNLAGLIADPSGEGLGEVERIQGDAKLGAKNMQIRERSADYLREEGHKLSISGAQGNFAKAREKIYATTDEEIIKSRAMRKAEQGVIASERTRDLDALEVSRQHREDQFIFGEGADEAPAGTRTRQAFAAAEAARRQAIFDRAASAGMGVTSKYDKDEAGIRIRGANDEADVARNETFQKADLEAKTRYATMQLWGRVDAAELGLKRDVDIAEEERAEGPLRGQLETLHGAEERLQRMTVGRNATIRQARDNAIIAQNFSSINRDPYSGAMAGAIAENVSDIAGAQLAELPRVLMKTFSRISKVADDITREVNAEGLGYHIESEVSGYTAAGKPFEADRAVARGRAEGERQKLPSMQWALTHANDPGLLGWVANKFVNMQIDVSETEKNNLQAIQKRQDEYKEGLTLQRDVTAALAQGEEPGGLQRTAKVREIAGQTKIAADREGDVSSRMLILETGINRLKAFQRDLENEPGGPQAIGFGAQLAGFSGTTQDKDEALKENTEAIKDLNKKLDSLPDDFSGGDSSGGDF